MSNSHQNAVSVSAIRTAMSALVDKFAELPTDHVLREELARAAESFTDARDAVEPVLAEYRALPGADAALAEGEQIASRVIAEVEAFVDADGDLYAERQALIQMDKQLFGLGESVLFGSFSGPHGTLIREAMQDVESGREQIRNLYAVLGSR